MSKMNLSIYSDFDGTITEIDLGDDLFKQYGTFEPYHSQLLSGELNIAKYWQILTASLPADLTPEGIRQYAMAQHTDAYFKDFADFCQENGIDLTVVSDGFDAYINPVLEKLGLSQLPRYCNELRYSEQNGFKPHFPRASESCNCLVASCKRNALLINTPPENIIVYIGDGYSDFCAAEYSDIVFAKKKLASYCYTNKIPHHSFHSFFEVKQIMRKLIKERRLKPRHQAYLKRKAAFEAE